MSMAMYIWAQCMLMFEIPSTARTLAHSGPHLYAFAMLVTLVPSLVKKMPRLRRTDLQAQGLAKAIRCYITGPKELLQALYSDA